MILSYLYRDIRSWSFCPPPICLLVHIPSLLISCTHTSTKHLYFVLTLYSVTFMSCRPVLLVLPCALVFTVSDSHCTVITLTSLANSDMDSQEGSLCCQSCVEVLYVCGREKEIQGRTIGCFVLGR